MRCVEGKIGRFTGMMPSTYQTLGRNKQRPFARTCGNSGAYVARLNGDIDDGFVVMSAVLALYRLYADVEPGRGMRAVELQDMSYF